MHMMPNPPLTKKEFLHSLTKGNCYVRVNVVGVTKPCLALPDRPRGAVIRAALDSSEAEHGTFISYAVQLVAEPDNAYDTNAVRVDLEGLDIGFIPRKGRVSLYYDDGLEPDTYSSDTLNADLMKVPLIALWDTYRFFGEDNISISIKLRHAPPRTKL